MRRLVVLLQRYSRKRLFVGFKIGLTAFEFLFLEHWMLFCVDWMYGCQDTGENIYLPALKLGLRHLQFYF